MGVLLAVRNEMSGEPWPLTKQGIYKATWDPGLLKARCTMIKVAHIVRPKSQDLKEPQFQNETT